jgi:hypothetical protein
MLIIAASRVCVRLSGYVLQQINLRRDLVEHGAPLSISTQYTRLLGKDQAAAHIEIEGERIPPQKTSGYIGSRGRFCHSVTVSRTASVTVEMRSGETSRP